ncbi:MAG: hypothetical protein ACI9T7_001175, partial [Oleiphilaceae bacterium]
QLSLAQALVKIDNAKALQLSYVKLRVFTQPTYPKITLLKTLTPATTDWVSWRIF